MTRLGVLPLARETFDVAYAEELAGAGFAALDTAGFDVVGPRRLLFDAPSTAAAVEELAGTPLDLLLVMQVTFTDASMAEVIASEIAAPIALWAFPEERTGGRLRLNAFCGINLAAFALRRAGRGFRYLFRDPAGEGIVDALRALATGSDLVPGVHAIPDPAGLAPDAVARAAEVEGRLAGSRVGVIGDHPVGFGPCGYERGAVAALTGVDVVRLELEDLFGAASAVADGDLAETRAREAAALDGFEAVDQDELDRSLRLYPALRGIASASGLDGLAVRCWPEAFTEYGGAVCAPAGLMNDDRLPTACEADVYGSITALVLQWLSGGAALVADLIDVDPASGTGVLWHCGKGPLSMTDPAFRPRATVHSNRRKPLLHEFPFRPGRVTIARLSQAGGHHSLVVGGGEMLSAPPAFSGTSGVVRFDTPAAAVADTVMREGLEHHYGFTYGDVRPELNALAAAWQIPVVEL